MDKWIVDLKKLIAHQQKLTVDPNVNACSKSKTDTGATPIKIALVPALITVTSMPSLSLRLIPKIFSRKMKRTLSF